MSKHDTADTIVQILTDEGYRAFWYLCRGTIQITHDAPTDVWDSALALAGAR
jgi:hypothetical protein